MFGMHRYFVVGSAIVLAIAMMFVGFLYNQLAIRNLVEIAEDHNVALGKTLSQTIWSRFGPYLLSASSLDPDALRRRPETAEIDQVLKPIIEGLDFLKVKIYGLNGVTIYSTQHSELGQNRNESPNPSAFFSAAFDGRPKSELTSKDRITAFSGEVFDRDVVETYVSMRNASQIFAVLEIYADVTDLTARLRREILTLVIGLFVIFATMYAALVFIVMRRAMAPLRAASGEAANIGPRSPGVRLPVSGMAAEILPLIDAVNSALDRLDKALELQRQFTTDAAHELLTPLAVLRANLDTLEDRDSAAALRQDVDAMSQIVDGLFELAEFDGLRATGAESADMHGISIEVIGQIAPLAYGQSKSLALTGEDRPLWVRCRPAALASALRNLINNAVAHTPVGSSVEVELSGDGCVSVRDHGPGVPPEERQQIFERFWRGADRKYPGAGLGLSIVKRFVDAYGGSIEVGDAPSGGAVFTMRLPPAP